MDYLIHKQLGPWSLPQTLALCGKLAAANGRLDAFTQPQAMEGIRCVFVWVSEADLQQQIQLEGPWPGLMAVLCRAVAAALPLAIEAARAQCQAVAIAVQGVGMVLSRFIIAWPAAKFLFSRLPCSVYVVQCLPSRPAAGGLA
jgi:hypothetical protein